MKKLSKLLLVLMLISVIVPTITVYAEPNTPPAETEEVDPNTPPAETDPEATPEETDPEATPEEAEQPSMKVDEDNESPELYENPDQSKREKEVIKKPIETPASVTGEKYRGSGTVVDFTTTGSKAFYTVKAPDHSVFYIVIDMDKTEDNVYFMSEINGEELNLSDVAPKPNTPTTEENKPTPPKAEQPEQKKDSNLTFWLILILGSIGFIGYHLFFGKLKNLNPLLNKGSSNKEDTDENDEYETDIYNEQEMPDDDEEFIVNDLEEDE